MCTLVATSADVFDWATVPVKKVGNLRNFQRPEIKKHVEDIQKYFSQYSNNCSPSSIVVGFRTAPKCLGQDGKDLQKEKVLPGEPPTQGFIEIEYSDAPQATSTAELRSALGVLVADEIQSTRALIGHSGAEIFDPGEAISEDASTDTTDDQADDDEEADSDEGDSAEDQDDDLSVASADSSEIVKQRRDYLEYLEALDVNSLDDNDLRENLAALRDIRKPGLIIDGQHRIRGTKQDDIAFAITALPDAPWPELAFQFIVLNKAARKVHDSLLISIVGFSLADDELRDIEQRLDDSGIPVPLYQGVIRVHEDPQSPFKKMLRFRLDNDPGIIDAAAARTKLVDFWFKCRVYPLVKHLMPGKTKKEKLHAWQASSLWFDYFCAFWNAAKSYYEDNSSLWDRALEEDGRTPSSKLLRATILGLTQETIIRYMREALTTEIKNDPTKKKKMKVLLPDLETFKTFCALYFGRLKPEFFQDWGSAAQGFDGSKGVRDAYCEAVTDVISGDKTIPQVKSGPNPNLIFKK